MIWEMVCVNNTLVEGRWTRIRTGRIE